MKCKDCKVLTFVEEYGEKYPWCDMLDDCPNIEFERDCPKFERMSNADAIRNMSDEELAEFIKCPRDMHLGDCRAEENETIPCSECILQWLKSEVKE